MASAAATKPARVSGQPRGRSCPLPMPRRRSYWPGPAPSGPSARTMLRAAALRHSHLSRGSPARDVARAPAPWRSRAAPLPALGCAAAGRRAVASALKRLRSIGGARVGAKRRPLSRPAPQWGAGWARACRCTPSQALQGRSRQSRWPNGQPCKAWPGVPVAMSVLGPKKARNGPWPFLALGPGGARGRTGARPHCAPRRSSPPALR